MTFGPDAPPVRSSRRGPQQRVGSAWAVTTSTAEFGAGDDPSLVGGPWATRRGSQRHAPALIADAGGSNGSRCCSGKSRCRRLLTKRPGSARFAVHRGRGTNWLQRLLLHQPVKLARQAAAKFPNHRQLHRKYHHCHRPQAFSVRAEYPNLPGWHQGLWISNPRSGQTLARPIPLAIGTMKCATSAYQIVARRFLAQILSSRLPPHLSTTASALIPRSICIVPLGHKISI